MLSCARSAGRKNVAKYATTWVSNCCRFVTLRYAFATRFFLRGGACTALLLVAARSVVGALSAAAAFAARRAWSLAFCLRLVPRFL